MIYFTYIDLITIINFDNLIIKNKYDGGNNKIINKRKLKAIFLFII